MIVSKLLVWVTVVFCHLATCNELQCKFVKYCQPVNSSWWRCRSEIVHKCSDGKKYHCAKDYDSPEVFKEDCAKEKFCLEGEEPFLSYIKDGRTVTEPEVYCRTCTDKDRYNGKKNTSSAELSECPDKKWNICTEEEHKILCKPEDSTEERYCRCDARKGFYPVNDLSYQKCSYKDYDCRNSNKCKSEEELLLNYTCAPKCDEGFARLNVDNDDCERLPSMKTTKTVPIPSTSARTGNGTTTVPSTKAPETSRQLPLECDEECEEFQICDSGKCVCPEVCAAVYEPVCGYHEESDNFETFSSKCQLNIHYCQQRKFVFFANGECKTGTPFKWIIPIVAGLVVLCLVVVYLFLKSPFYKKCRDRFCPYPSNMEIIVPDPNSSETVVDGSKPNGNHTTKSQSSERYIERQLSAPLSIHEDSSTPNLTSTARKVIITNTTIYKGPVIQTKKGNTQISIESSPRNRNKRVKMMVNRKDIVEGEDEWLLDSEDESRNTIPDVVVHRVEKEEDHTLPTAQPSDIDSNIPMNNSSNPSSATADSTLERNDTDVSLETDISEEKQKNEQVLKRNTAQKLGSFYKRHRKMSVSYDSLFLEPDIQDVTEVLPTKIETLLKGSDNYKNLINKVMDKCLTYLLDNMDPTSLLDRFTTKEMLTHVKIRDISDLQKQTEKSREIVKRIREGGTKNYQTFKVCLWETKQENCLAKVEEIQSEVLETMKQSVEGVPQQSNERLPDSYFHSDIPKNHQDITSETDTDVLSGLDPFPSTSLNQEKVCHGTDSQSSNSQECAKTIGEDEFHDHYKEQQAFRKGPSFVPPEKVLEERALQCLHELSSIRAGKFDSLDEVYQKFEGRCKEIGKQVPELTSATLIPDKLPDSLENQEKYMHTPVGFQAYKSSGKDKSCFYQSISLLLTKTEDRQYCLRLLATLHAVKFYKIYKKQLMMQEVEKLKSFFCGHTNESTYKKICDARDAEYIINICLQTLIMETSCLGTDSSVLHVGFLCGALGMNIHQHFQQKYVAEIETIPWVKIIQGDWVNPDKSDLHILWVNHSKEEKGIMDHIVPLLRKESTTVTEHAS